jgi:hypothetical protein
VHAWTAGDALPSAAKGDGDGHGHGHGHGNGNGKLAHSAVAAVPGQLSGAARVTANPINPRRGPTEAPPGRGAAGGGGGGGGEELFYPKAQRTAL